MSKLVRFNYADRTLRVTGKQGIKTHIEWLFENEGKPLDQLTYIFCSDNYLLGINQSFLQHDYYTDIITFDLSEPKKREINAEIYISVDRVWDNAKQLNIPFKEEMLRVIFHGALHLCGYKDKTKQQTTVMRAKEEYYISTYLKKNS
ncbi:rRNA maturation RNase YbeY [Foetidibacter luteolus]|uniref:rRNA maturation RNase YbeY n=1 Tax=Foetidibacter luteolus TaxID=2608880 RepID=UPI00129B94CB|nr:rRNA maturation RNase YbeY [Foetidibacter luteolus]